MERCLPSMRFSVRVKYRQQLGKLRTFLPMSSNREVQGYIHNSEWHKIGKSTELVSPVTETVQHDALTCLEGTKEGLPSCSSRW